MRKITLLTLLVLVLAACSLAQGVPRAEIYGGYSFVKLDTGFSGADTFNSNGWAGAVTGNLNRFFGIKAELSGQYHSESITAGSFGTATGALHVHNFLFGPQLGYRSGRLRPFVHALFGLSHGTLNVSATGVPKTELLNQNAFGMTTGGGLDVSINRLISIRLGQIDYLRTQFDLSQLEPGNTAQNHFRYTGGIVLNLGE